jgi:hypothetical protein
MRGLCLLVVCTTVAAGAAAAGDGLSASELRKAQKLDKKKCYRCHKPYDPKDYSVEDWDVWMGKMSRKARLKSKDEELLRRYFAAQRQP